MTVQELINELEKIKKQFGNLPVLLSSDEEQNSIGDVLQVQCGELTKYDDCHNKELKIGDRIIVIVPAL